jgi:hypothetical protein
VGPYINGYAFGDIDELIRIIESVQRERKAVPDLTKIYPRVTFKPKSEWDAGNKGLNEGLTKLLVTLKKRKGKYQAAKDRTRHGSQVWKANEQGGTKRIGPLTVDQGLVSPRPSRSTIP